MVDETENNVFRIISGSKDDQVVNKDAIPSNEYVIVDRDGSEHYAEGFALFTSQHVAIMRDNGNGALPILILPLDNVAFCELIEDEEVFDEATPDLFDE